MKIYVKVLLVLSAILLCADVIGAEEECGENEEMSGCGPYCEATCAKPQVDICPRMCLPMGCRCPQPFVRNGSNKCVRVNQCPNVRRNRLTADRFHFPTFPKFPKIGPFRPV